MAVDGSYDCITKSPMGDQKSVFTVTSDGDSFSGQNAGAMGSTQLSAWLNPVQAGPQGQAVSITTKAAAPAGAVELPR